MSGFLSPAGPSIVDSRGRFQPLQDTSSSTAGSEGTSAARISHIRIQSGRGYRGGGTRMRKRSAGVFAAVVLAGSVWSGGWAVSAEERPLYKDPSATIDERTDDLLARMTLAEKVHQLATMYPNGNVRLGIPHLKSAEALHGVTIAHATSFPSPLAMGSTWNPNLIERMGSPSGAGGESTGGAPGVLPNARRPGRFAMGPFRRIVRGGSLSRVADRRRLHQRPSGPGRRALRSGPNHCLAQTLHCRWTATGRSQRRRHGCFGTTATRIFHAAVSRCCYGSPGGQLDAGPPRGQRSADALEHLFTGGSSPRGVGI